MLSMASSGITRATVTRGLAAGEAAAPAGGVAGSSAAAARGLAGRCMEWLASLSLQHGAAGAGC